MRRWVCLLAVVTAGCVSADLVECADGRACPVGTVCDVVHAGCVDPDQLSACDGADAYASCAAVDGGRCFDGVCLAGGCGNALLEPEELCDDGNPVGDDGCSADCRSREICGDGFADGRIGEQCDDGDRESHDGCTARCEFEDFEWRLQGGRPFPRRSLTMGYDAARGRAVVFGGVANAMFVDDTWEWNGRTWTLMGPPVKPLARADAAMAYDPVRRRLVMFGGLGVTGQQNDTWEWDGARWHPMRPVTKPLARFGHAMGWDPTTKRIIMHGGDVTIASIDDTWSWDGVDWTSVPVTSYPGARFGHALVTDPAAGQLILLGGQFDRTETSTRYSGSWVFTGTGWVRHTPDGSWPGASSTVAAYDLARRVIVVRGSRANPPPALPTPVTYELAGVSWSDRTAATPSALPLFDFAAVYDTGRRRVITFGGGTVPVGGPLNDIFEWNGSDWLPRVTDRVPSRRTLASMAFDPRRGTTVMFGGVDPDPTNPRANDETWEWDGDGWTEIVPPTLRPSARFAAAMAYDAVLGEVVLHGGTPGGVDHHNDTWSWNGVRWLLRHPGGAGAPPDRNSAVMAQDPRRNRLVLFGGEATSTQDLADTWEWDGTAWSQVMTANRPPARKISAMTYDLTHDRMLLQGGATGGSSFPDMWQYDGTAWTALTPPVIPSLRTGHVLVHDRARRNVLNLGGVPDFSIWEWSGTSWSQTSTTIEPAILLSPSAIYDPVRAETMMFGGANLTLTQASDATWLGRYRGPTEELCRSGHDHDGDGAIGCADSDCAFTCETCGDGMCGTLETDRMCPADCLPAPAVCGDYYCAPGESCTTDCF